MFGTWKYGRAAGQVESLKISHDYETARSSQHQACNRCHEKKLKCSGEKDGCERCTSQGLACEYSRSGSRQSKKGRKSDGHSTCSSRSGRDCSGSPKSSHRSHVSKSKDKRGSHQSSGTRGDPLTTSGDMYHGSSSHAGYGTNTFDGYEMLASTTEAGPSGYAASAPMEDYTTGVNNYATSNWVLDDNTSAAHMNQSFMATSESMYTNDDAASYADYSNQAGYDMYQGDVDPRFWDQSHHQP